MPLIVANGQVWHVFRPLDLATPVSQGRRAAAFENVATGLTGLVRRHWLASRFNITRL